MCAAIDAPIHSTDVRCVDSVAGMDRMAILGPQRVEFALLRGDPRVTALRKKVGLPE